MQANANSNKKEVNGPCYFQVVVTPKSFTGTHTHTHTHPVALDAHSAQHT